MPVSYFSREYCSSKNSHLPYNISNFFYFTVFTLRQEKFDFKSSVSSTFACICKFFCSGKLPVVETSCCQTSCYWAVSAQPLLSLPFVTKDLKKKLVSFRNLMVLFVSAGFSIFWLTLFTISHKISWIAIPSASNSFVIFSRLVCLPLNIFFK